MRSSNKLLRPWGRRLLIFFASFLPAAGCLRVTGTEEDGVTEQQRKREHHGAGWDVGVRANHTFAFFVENVASLDVNSD